MFRETQQHDGLYLTSNATAHTAVETPQCFPDTPVNPASVGQPEKLQCLSSLS